MGGRVHHHIGLDAVQQPARGLGIGQVQVVDGDEGNINSERIIAMLTVKDDTLIVEEKGIYSIEEFLVARRLMYWQVYLHKTSIGAEFLLIKVFERVKELYKEGKHLPMTPALEFFV